MFVRNKIPRYSSCPTPSSTSSSFTPLPSLLPKATHSAEPSFLFISAKFPPHQPQPSTPPPPPSLSLSLSFSSLRIPPPPRETTLYATRNLPSYTSYEAEDGSDGGSYGINKSGAHAPQLPSLLPARRHLAPPLRPNPPSLLRGRRFNPPIPHLFYRVHSSTLSFSLFLEIDIPVPFP